MRYTLIDLIRHGEPVGGSKYRGQQDDPLSDTGWQQMRQAVGDHHPWDVIISSPLSRCADFAKELAERYGLPLEMDERLMEIGFGEWEGHTAAQLLARDAQVLMRFWSDPLHNTPPGAETLQAFRERVIAAWEGLVARHLGKHLLVVGHAGIMRMILCHTLGMPLANLFRLQVANAGITRIRIDHDEQQSLPRLLFHGGTL